MQSTLLLAADILMNNVADDGQGASRHVACGFVR